MAGSGAFITVLILCSGTPALMRRTRCGACTASTVSAKLALDALLQHQQPRGDRAAPAAKLVLVELGHRVVDVEYDLAAEKAGRKRA